MHKLINLHNQKGVPMDTIIQHVNEVSIKAFVELQKEFFKNPKDFASYVYGISAELQKIGLMIIRESLEDMDRMYRESGLCREKWVINRKDAKQLVTSLGTVDFSKTLFRNKSTGELSYLLDDVLGMDPHARMTEDAEAQMLEEAVQTSYRRGGDAVNPSDSISKTAVKDKLHNLRIPHTWEKPEEKKAVEYLYIEADEDHISLQYREQKGDLVQKNGIKNNTLISKLIYVHEGVAPDAPKSRRYHLVNPHYFARVCDEKGNNAFWDEVYQYILDNYDVEQIKKIYLSADGGSWIKSGMKRLAGITYVLDEFHLTKYLIRLTSHMKDSTDDARSELYRAIRKGTKAEFNEIVDRLKDCLPDATGEARIEEARSYFLNNWGAARNRLLKKDGVIGGSTEGHVSHILSSRMSSRPMGWSRIGAAKMTELRAYYKNGGDMLELVRYQKKELPKVAGDEDRILLSARILSQERKASKKDGKYFDAIQCSVSLDTAKKVWFNGHIWGL